ncbi:MAG: hypothetical protein ABIK68_02175 [bacterium]
MENASLNGQDEKTDEVPKKKEEIGLFPNSPAFFGDRPSFAPKAEKGLFRSLKRLPSLSEYRTAINSDLTKDPARNHKIRKELNALSAKFPNSADLQALKAIQSYHDVQQSGLGDQKFAILESIVLNLGRAINTHAYSLNNLSWFLKVFLHYLEVMQKRVLTGYPIRGIGYSNAKRQLAVLHIQTKKSIREFESLNTKYEKTSFYSESISASEIIEAYGAIRKGNEKIPVGKFNRPALIVQIIHLKINLILSRFPIFSATILQNLEATKDIIHRDVFLLNGMIALNRLLNEYYLIKASGDIERQKQILAEVVHKCKENGSYLQDNQTLGREFEYDPLLKFAILTLEVWKYDFAQDYKTAMLSQARTGLFKIINRSFNQAAIRQANRYFNAFDEHCNPDAVVASPRVFRTPARDLLEEDSE